MWACLLLAIDTQMGHQALNGDSPFGHVKRVAGDLELRRQNVKKCVQCNRVDVDRHAKVPVCASCRQNITCHSCGKKFPVAEAPHIYKKKMSGMCKQCVEKRQRG